MAESVETTPARVVPAPSSENKTGVASSAHTLLYPAAPFTGRKTMPYKSPYIGSAILRE